MNFRLAFTPTELVIICIYLKNRFQNSTDKGGNCCYEILSPLQRRTGKVPAWSYYWEINESAVKRKQIRSPLLFRSVGT